MADVVHKLTKEEFMNVLEVNIVGTFLITKYLISLMQDIV